MGEGSERLTGRAGQMARSLGSALSGHGIDEPGRDAVLGVFGLAMQPRIERLDDDHHPAWLHPGRTALVLLQDVGAVDPVVLVVAMLHDSVDAPLRVAPTKIEETVGAAALQALATIPLPGDERLVERLLLLGPGLALAALAERLDQLRHLHLREELIDGWADVHGEVSQAWLPFAARVNPTLTRRYAHWVRTFANRI